MADKPRNMPYVDAVEYLTKGGELARRFVESGEQYLAILAELARPKVEVNAFYQTVDQSVVRVVKEFRRGGCGDCGNRPTGLTGMNIGDALNQVLSQIAGARNEADTGGCSSSDDPDDLFGYLCCVVIGGHGHAGLHGEKPGEQYAVGPTGLVLLAPPGNDAPSPGQAPTMNDCGVLVTSHLRMVGLCLVKKVMVLVRED